MTSPTLPFHCAFACALPSVLETQPQTIQVSVTISVLISVPVTVTISVPVPIPASCAPGRRRLLWAQGPRGARARGRKHRAFARDRPVRPERLQPTGLRVWVFIGIDC